MSKAKGSALFHVETGLGQAIEHVVKFWILDLCYLPVFPEFFLGLFLVIKGERVFHVFAFCHFQLALSIMFSFCAFA